MQEEGRRRRKGQTEVETRLAFPWSSPPASDLDLADELLPKLAEVRARKGDADEVRKSWVTPAVEIRMMMRRMRISNTL